MIVISFRICSLYSVVIRSKCEPEVTQPITSSGHHTRMHAGTPSYFGSHSHAIILFPSVIHLRQGMATRSCCLNPPQRPSVTGASAEHEGAHRSSCISWAPTPRGSARPPIRMELVLPTPAPAHTQCHSRPRQACTQPHLGTGCSVWSGWRRWPCCQAARRGPPSNAARLP
jgi:hypothetical protein